MNDWWNDPPEEPEFYETELVSPQPVYDTLEEKEMDYEEPPAPAKCPHGNEWGSCDHCDFLGDLAYDAAREKRL